MNYKAVEVKQHKNEIKQKLIDTYLSCKTWDEFRVKADIEVPYANKNDLRACKIYYIKNMYGECLYYGAWIGLLVGLVFIGTILSLLFNTSIQSGIWLIGASSGVLVWMLVIMLHFSLHVDFIQTLEWHENGCPIDY